VRGTHSAPIIDQFGTIPPTGKQIAVTGITIDRWSNGQLVEEWLYGDMLGFMQQLGLMPQPDK
jgi:predicted ester cyclase